MLGIMKCPGLQSATRAARAHHGIARAVGRSGLFIAQCDPSTLSYIPPSEAEANYYAARETLDTVA